MNNQPSDLPLEPVQFANVVFGLVIAMFTVAFPVWRQHVGHLRKTRS